MTQAVRPRPLSPHLSIYRPQITSVLSISHRITGVFLALGTLLLTAWLWSAAYEPTWFTCITQLMSHWLGMLLLAGWTFALYFHLSNGIRHLFWDMGKGFEIPTVTKTGVAVVIAAVLLTAGTWVYALNNTSVKGETANVTSQP
ncbi:MAG: succinate dehydrogenase, cytochrome b556 subunit [Alphaproteobacteria bacterium]|nr:succinate dehydrogenase, cytochrome b556 subunit [Alphaproteobacteria bacterium]